jgi:hypothetical protein
MIENTDLIQDAAWKLIYFGSTVFKNMATKNIPLRPSMILMIAVLVIALIINNHNTPRSIAALSHKQPVRPQDFATCVNKSLDKILNGYLNFSDPDPISHCYDQLFNGNVNNRNGTENKGNNNLSDNSSFANVWDQLDSLFIYIKL